MSAPVTPVLAGTPGAPAPGAARREPAWVRWLLISIALGFLAVFLVIPLGVVLHAAFADGLAPTCRPSRSPTPAPRSG